MVTARSLYISLELWGALACFLISVCTFQKKSSRIRVFFWISLCQALLLICDAVSLLAERNPSFVNYSIVVAGNTLVYALGYLLMILFTLYITVYLRRSGKVTNIPLYINGALFCIAIVLLLVSIYNHMYYAVNANSVYVQQDMFWLSQAIGISGLCVDAVLIFIYKKRIVYYHRIAFYFYIFMPIVAMVFQIFTDTLPLMYLANTVSIIITFQFIQMEYIKKGKTLAQQISQKDAELSRSLAKLSQTRMDLMRSQIQPHFIYNTLSTIGELCITQPQKANEIINEFSLYLRGNFDELGTNHPIRLSREIEHVKHYTAIEHVRFPDMKIYYDLRSSEFFLPALTIQPLVENAIKHGLMGLDHGGTVVISTYETDSTYCVCVRDNGIGFDTNSSPASDGRKHLGIANIRERIEILCHGTLTIESAPGRGTVALIKIPKEKK